MNLPQPFPFSRRQALLRVATALSAIAASQAALPLSAHQSPASEGTKITPLTTRDLAGHDESEVHMVLVEFQGGANSPPHQHAGPVFVYVLEGTVEMQITDGPLTKLSKGEIYYEPPGVVHLVSRNASATEPARLLAFVIGKKGVPATGPVEHK